MDRLKPGLSEVLSGFFRKTENKFNVFLIKNDKLCPYIKPLY